MNNFHLIPDDKCPHLHCSFGMTFDVPVVLLCFNRPDLTRKVMEQLARIQPSQFFVVCDGPRHQKQGEDQLVADTRKIALNPTWKTEVRSNLAEKNLGCKKRISSGLDWVFSQVPEAIIVEDDCWLDESFFHFCRENLAHYRNDEQVFHITAENLVGAPIFSSDSYFFSNYSPIWGWASWARAWKNYDVSMTKWPSLREKFKDHVLYPSFESVWKGEVDTWDYQWVFTLLAHDALCLVPRENLVENLGFRDDATHTLDRNSPMARLKASALSFPLKHPQDRRPRAAYDSYLQKVIFSGANSRNPRSKFHQMMARI